jgi:acyl transferase domain-containing protein
MEGREAVSEVPADRWNIERFYDPEPGIPGKTFAKRGGNWVVTRIELGN